MKQLFILLLVISFIGCSKEDISNDQKVLETINGITQFESNVKTGVSLVFFHAVWCSKCAEQRPAVEALTKDAQLNAVFFGQVDYEKNSDIRTKYGVAGFPTILIFKDGVVKHDLSGKGHTQEELTNLLKALL